MSFLSDARKSWQMSTKFREHLSFINTTSKPTQPSNLKSAWSPVTPTDDGHVVLRSPPPPVPPVPAIHAAHVHPTERDVDDHRSVERARAEAAAALERGAQERETERQRLDRERQQRQQLALGNQNEQKREIMSSSDHNLDDGYLEEVDLERAESGQARNAPQSFAARSKAAFGRLSRAVFRFTSTPVAEPSSPYPRDSFPSHLRRDSAGPSQPRLATRFPSQLSDLSPWPALNVTHRDEQSRTVESPPVHHHHYYAATQPGSRSASRAASLTEGDHVHRDIQIVEKGRLTKKICRTCHAEKKKKKNSVLCWIILIIILLFLLGNVIFLNVRVLNNQTVVSTPDSAGEVSASPIGTKPLASTAPPGKATTTAGRTTTGSQATTTTSEASSTPTVDPAIASCISQFNSLTNPPSYPCDQCVPILSAIPNDLSPSSSSPPSVTGQGNVLQFCALKSINDGLPTANANVLTNVGWLKDNRPCAWQGVTCDSQGRISTLELVAPGLPNQLPQNMQFLVGLQTLSIIGDNKLPGEFISPIFARIVSDTRLSAGSVTPLLSLGSLQSLTIQQTGLAAAFNAQTPFTSLSSLKSLTLIQNSQISIPGNDLGGLTSMPLTSLVLNFLSIPTNTLQSLTSASSTLAGSLTLLDLTSTSQTGAVPNNLPQALPNLVELHLDNNAYTSLPDPTTNGGVVFGRVKRLLDSGTPSLDFVFITLDHLAA
ncbi:hypothetical protein FRB99_004065 [Tulasnella sp. 403]|nr:hypothetical protein FRB99_004065 [Tulasnella sp. 403]